MKKIISFTLLAYGISWFFWFIAYGITSNLINIKVNSELFMILGRFGPSLAGIIFLLPMINIKSLLKNTFSVGKKLKNIVLTFLALPMMYGLIFVFVKYILKEDVSSEWLSNPMTIIILFAYILFLGGPLGEEIGWRGYMLPKLLNRFNVFTTSIILGLVWTFWHLPTFFIEGNVQNDIPFVLYTLYTVSLSIWITLLVLKTKKIGTAVFFHTSANFGLGLFYVLEVKSGLYVMAIIMVTSLLITIIINRKTLFSYQKLDLFKTKQ